MCSIVFSYFYVMPQAQMIIRLQMLVCPSIWQCLFAFFVLSLSLFTSLNLTCNFHLYMCTQGTMLYLISIFLESSILRRHPCWPSSDLCPGTPHTLCPGAWFSTNTCYCLTFYVGIGIILFKLFRSIAFCLLPFLPFLGLSQNESIGQTLVYLAF